MLKPTALIILDGFGITSSTKYNAITHANTPHLDYLMSHYPHTALKAAGFFVGLPDHLQGNSEVGHITIGAGRIIKQPLTQWIEAINNNSFYDNPVLIENFNKIANNGNAIHIIGLLSDAGVHCHEKLIYACIEAAYKQHIKKIIVHIILDGRDVAPQSAYHYIKELELFLKNIPHATIGSIHGRFYAMDRDKNWERTEKSYRVLTTAQTLPHETWERILEKNYVHNITDEFIEPIALTDCIIKNGDGIIFCNIRPDRARQLTASFAQPHFSHFVTKPIELAFFITPVEYDVFLPTSHLFNRPIIKNSLKDVLAQHNKTIFTIAETEKYAHVTYFFRGENEEPVATETRTMIPSIKTTTFAHFPCMSAQQITDTVIASLYKKPYNFYLINYANADMVGHSGDFDATIKAIECLDAQLKQLYDVIVQQMDGTLFITADHGKAEVMFDEKTHQAYTGHTANPVPFIMVNIQYNNKASLLPLSELADIAPFILKYLQLPIANEMNNNKKIKALF